MDRIALIAFFLLSLISCSSGEDNHPTDNDDNGTQAQEFSDEFIADEHIMFEEPIMFQDAYTKKDDLIDRDLMEKALIDIGAAAYTESPLVFKDVEKYEDGYSRECDYDYNGSISFLVGTGEEPNYYYGFPEPGMERSSLDLSMYHVRSIHVDPEKELFELETVYIEVTEGEYSLYMNGITYVTIWQEEKFGTVIKMGNDYFLEEYYYDQIPHKNCPEYVP